MLYGLFKREKEGRAKVSIMKWARSLDHSTEKENISQRPVHPHGDDPEVLRAALL